MSIGVIAAIVAGAFLVGAIADRGNTNPGFKAEQHKTMNDPSKSDN